MKNRKFPCLLLAAMLVTAASGRAADTSQTLPGTAHLELQGDLAEQMVAGVDRFLLSELESSIDSRAERWHRDLSSPTAYQASVELNRRRLARIIGLRDQRVKCDKFELVGTRSEPALIGRASSFDIYQVHWPVLEGVHGEGLLLEPTAAPARAGVVVMADCQQTPEALVGLLPGVAPESQIARRLAESGCRVIVPALIDRGNSLSVIAGGKRPSTVTHREILYRSAYQMGRHLIGYEVHKIQAALDALAHSDASHKMPLGVVGYGEGGLLALYAAAVDPRIEVAGVSGYFDSRQNLWREPIDRNVFGLLAEFGDAELATLIGPRTLIVEACAGPTFVIPPGGQSAPAELKSPAIETVRREVDRARNLIGDPGMAGHIELVTSDKGDGPCGTQGFVKGVLERLGVGMSSPAGAVPTPLREIAGIEERHARQFHELAAFSQQLVDAGPQVRAEFMTKLDTSRGSEKYLESAREYRDYFRNEIIGELARSLEAPNPRTRLVYDEEAFRGYEVVLDVFPDVIFYGILLVPKDLKSGERRPVVVCQHGLEGRAQSTVEGDQTSYRDFAARLARRGFVTFSPQHLYRGGDRFRTLQRKANPLGKSLFSVMTAGHQQLLAWLGQLEFVDRERIAFYGISYGGKSAMRIPALVDGYCLSICSSDFSDWIWRTVSNRHDKGYLAHSEYEIFEFNLGSTFNYAELAALICPRPFMAEQFHSEGLVANMDSAEFGRVRLLYENLGIAERARLSHYSAWQPPAPYAERETFEFLHEHLRPPRR